MDAQPAAQGCLASIRSGEAEPAARTCLPSTPSAQDLHALATSVQVFARAEKGEYEQSLAEVKALFKKTGSRPQVVAQSDAATAFAVGEAYFQRLIQSGRYDVARKLCELACNDDTPAALKDHFRARMARLDLLDEPAPVVSRDEMDGLHESLTNLKRKVVLVDFWESRCSHCVASITALSAMAQKYHRQGFATSGVNVDARHPEVTDGTTALPIARQLPVRHGVSWTYLPDGQGMGNGRTPHGVLVIPTNFLISHDGGIFAVLHGDASERNSVRAKGGLAGVHSK